MNKQEIRQKAIDIIDNNKIGTLATVVHDKPHSRYMTFYNEDLTLYTPTSKETHKAEELEQNPNVHVLLGYNGEGIGDEFVEIEGTADIRDSNEIKEKIWNEELERWFDGKNDPNLIVLEINPTAIRVMNDKGEPPHSVDL
ncbi:pyridoxamine 5'-phosphate oxidase family protein [Thalassorhabdus alkalitolerans]|uniref:Pyridoxamine 5'-phosphate oxidase family protein n=1 Tax=Thalassorhabdus alkalitolerans TaxID=2282697 RepID=A0ABW0YLZ7_9BACI|nr:pyridoxamine 5'-phosphate oxidase family protein [Thalassobacillus sp. C254]